MCRDDVTRHFFLIPLASSTKVFLVNATNLYVYNGADLFGVDSWIPVRDHVDIAHCHGNQRPIRFLSVQIW